ncbi:MAG: M23 family metallopeptidase [Bacteroidota bacterium]|nr:M23 family metallopeptidase [Bacteroidota bacterium]
MAKEKQSFFKHARHWLNTAYRLVILNDETFGEKFSIKLSPLSLIIAVSAITIVMTTLVISLISLTSLREYIPGYGNVYDRRKLLKITQRADSIEQTLDAKEEYINNLINVFNEKEEPNPLKPKKDSLKDYSKINNEPSKNDLEFRKEIEESKGNQATVAYTKTKTLNDLVFYSPVKGLVTTSYNIQEDHFGVDVVTKPDESIKAPLDGTIIYTGFTVEDGYIIHIQHGNNLMSVFKHNSHLNKRTGERVKTGEVISSVGNTGINSKGPHMHFELWYNGTPVNPEEFVSF